MDAWDKSRGCSKYFISHVSISVSQSQYLKKRCGKRVLPHTCCKQRDVSRCLQWQREELIAIRSCSFPIDHQRLHPGAVAIQSCYFHINTFCQTKWRVDILSLRDFILNICFLPVQLSLPLCLYIRPMELLYVVWGHICIYTCVWCGHPWSHLQVVRWFRRFDHSLPSLYSLCLSVSVVTSELSISQAISDCNPITIKSF